jgi:chemotaxis protein histidine kinase CheA
MSTDPSIRDQTYAYFLMEAPELLQNIENDLFSLMEDRSTARVHNLMRMTHTLKGAAASVGLDAIKRVSHSLEDVFKALYNPAVVIDAEIEALLFQGYECLRIPLTAEFTETPIDESELLNRAAAVFAQLQEKLGELFDQQAQIPSSAELGFDITESIFETGVGKRLDDLTTAMAESGIEQVTALLKEQASVFVGLAESLGLPGFGAIAQTTLMALDASPDQAATITQLALADFRAARAAVLGGDRSRGGEPSAALQALTATSVVDTGWLDFDPMAIPFPDLDSEEGLDAIELGAIAVDDFTLAEENGLEQLLGGLEVEATSDSVIDLGDELITADALDLGTLELGTMELGPLELDSAQTSLSLEDLFSNVSEPDEPATQPELETVAETPIPQRFKKSTAKSPPRPVAPVAAKPATPRSKEATAVTQTIRLELEKLRRLDYLAGELLTNQNRQTTADEQLQEVVQKLQLQLLQHRQLLQQIRDWSDQLLIRPTQPSQVIRQPAQSGFGLDTLELDPYGEFHVLLQSALEETLQLEETSEAVALFNQQLSQDLDKQRRLLTRVREDILTARRLPLGELFNRFPRLVQQLATTYKKPTTLQLSGTEVLIDKAIVEKLYDPLLHLLRNGFDHGLEAPEARRQVGKSETGQLQLQAYQRDRWTVITVSDDGKGLDFKKIFDRAVEKQLLRSEDASTLTETELLNCLFEPGFSTASQLSELSGRGIGLDVVKTQVESLQGKISIQTEPQRGTTFFLQIPFDLNVAKVVVCQAGPQLYAFLADTISQILLPKADQIQQLRGQRVLRWFQGKTEQHVPIRRLSECFDYTIPWPEEWQLAQGRSIEPVKPLLLLQQDQSWLALEVDQLIGEQELVIRPVGGILSPPSYVLGCCILADGHLTLLLDSGAFLDTDPARSETNRLVLSAHLAAPDLSTDADALPTATITPVLVVDDSITLRQNLALVLQKAGYQIYQARDGEEAILKLQQHPNIRLMICDVEMPGMNGFEFLSRRAQSPDFQKVPVIMLTSRSSPKHRQIAMELGANGYLTKPYLDQELLEKVASLIAQPALTYS